MRLISGLVRRHGLTFVVAMVAVAALWAVRRADRPAAPPEPSPAQMVAARFAPEPADRTGSVSAQLATRHLAQAVASRLALSPDSVLHAELPDVVLRGARPDQAIVYAGPTLGMVPPTSGAAASAVALPGDAAAGPQAGSRAAVANRHAAFSEGQIASIKERLKLTPAQAGYWPPVEAALRGLVWQYPRDHRARAIPTLDPDGIQKLAAAAGVLAAHLTPEQKREVRTLAFLLGLEKVASQL